MTREERLKSKSLYKIELYLIKLIPGLLAGTCLLNTVLSYFGINVPLLSYIGGVSFFMICFLYLSSIVFRFCIYHRLLIHYVTINWALNIYDWYIGIPCSDRAAFILYFFSFWLAPVFCCILISKGEKEWK